ncbi:MAG: hypothetical protein IH840_00445 [Candidatus Heimdallarchaeota archaeon]|nr:hypothetical protein [Candidatus Heimdallarchaeota archaeon]
MVIMMVEGLKRQVYWVDGYISSRLKETLGQQVDTKRDMDAVTLDSKVLSRLQNVISLGVGRGVEKCSEARMFDLYLFRVVENPSFMTRFSPPYVETSFLKEKQPDYRLISLVTETGYAGCFSRVLQESLMETNFHVRKESTFNDIEKFKSYLRSLTELVLQHYELPGTQVIKEFTRLGLYGRVESFS